MDLPSASVILLAAGKSLRMGSPKGLLPHNGRPWLEEQIRRIRHCGLSGPVVVVLGTHAEAYRRVLPPNVVSVVNPTPELGPFSSLQIAIRTQPRATHAFLLPLDVPCPLPRTWLALASGEEDICIPLHDGRGGHPVRLSSRFLQHLASLPLSDENARLDRQIQLASQTGTFHLKRVEVDDFHIRQNLNTPEDWERFKAVDAPESF